MLLAHRRKKKRKKKEKSARTPRAPRANFWRGLVAKRGCKRANDCC
jgi:hypothetical protein